MRWQCKPHELGEIRTRRKFLLLPKRIGTEWRWLEQTRWEEVWARVLNVDMGYEYVWKPKRWLD